jgi:hypothetical protein
MFTAAQASNALSHLERQIRATAGTDGPENDATGGSDENAYDLWASNQPGPGGVTDGVDDDA